MKRAGVVLFAVLAIVLAMGAVALAQEEQQFLGGKVRTGDTITVPASETVDGDLYIFGGNITVDGDVIGDLIVFGGTVEVGGTVGGDLMVGSGTLTLNGTVDGDLRVGAGQVTTNGNVGEDILAGTGRLTVNSGVGEDLVFGAGLTDVAGNVGGDILGETGSYTRSGTVGGSEDVTISQPREERQTNDALRPLYRFVSLLLIGLVILWTMRPTFQRSVAAVNDRPGPVSLWGIGFLFGLVIVPMAATLVGVLLAILFGWLGLGLIVGLILVAVFCVWVITGVAAFVLIAIVAPLTVGTWLAVRVLPDRTAGYLEMTAGIAVLVLVGLIPVVRVLVGLAVTIMGAGAWLSMLRGTSRQETAPAET